MTSPSIGSAFHAQCVIALTSDEDWFSDNPRRRFRFRLALQSELLAMRSRHGSQMTEPPAGRHWFVLAKRPSNDHEDATRFYLLSPNSIDTDIDDKEAQRLFDELSRRLAERDTHQLLARIQARARVHD